MVTKPDLYFPYNQREKTVVRLFQADIMLGDFGELKVKNHFKFHGICVAEVSCIEASVPP